MTVTNYATKWTANAIETPPDLTALVSSGYPTNGDPSKGIPPTLPGAPWFHWVAQSLATVIVGNGLALDQTKTDQLLDALKNFGKTVVPIGSVIFYLGTTIPDGYLLCNGASLSRTEYPELFAAIGDRWGSDSSSTFKLPDTHHRFFEGTTVLSEIGQYVQAGLPNILSSGRGFDDQFDISQYGFHDLTGAMFISRTGPRKYDRDMYESHTDGALAWTFDASRNSAVYGASGTNQPASVRFLCLIRAYQA